MAMDDGGLADLSSGKGTLPESRDRVHSLNLPGQTRSPRQSVLHFKTRQLELAKRNHDLSALAETRGDKLAQIELERQELMARLEEAILQSERAEAQVSYLKECLAASQEYITSLTDRGEIGPLGAALQAETLSRRLSTIEDRFSYRIVRRLQHAIETAIPPNSTRAAAWFALRQVARQPKNAKVHLLSLVKSGTQRDVSYHQWMLDQRPSPLEIQRQAATKFSIRPLISFIVPVYNPPVSVLRDTLEAVFRQTYANWELCLVNGDRRNRRIASLLDDYARRDSRVRLRHLEHNLGISGNSNAAIDMATGEFIALLDHDDTIEIDLLYSVVGAINAHPETDFVYFDQDMVSADGKHYELPLFKPAWSPELLLTAPFATHPVIRRRLVTEVGGFDPATDGTQDWDLFLRLAEHTTSPVHVPKVLYHWRRVSSSAAASQEAKPYAYARQLEAVERHMRRRGLTDATAAFATPGAVRVTWQPRGSLVSIIIPTHDNHQLLWHNLLSIHALTAYQNYEIIVVNTAGADRETSGLFAVCEQSRRTRVVECDATASQWKAHNFGAAHAQGDLLLFLDDNLEILHRDWLEELVRWAELPEIGVVGAKLLQPDGLIQHAGLVVGLDMPVGRIFAGSSEQTWGIFGSVEWYRNYSAVSGSCQMIPRDLFERVGGYDESYQTAFADVDICLQIGRAGRRVMYTPWARLVYQAGANSEMPATDEDLRRLCDHAAGMLEQGDPFFNRNLSHTKQIPSLDLSR